MGFGGYLPGLFEKFSRLIELSQCFKGIGYYSKDLAYEMPLLPSVHGNTGRKDEEWTQVRAKERGAE